MTTLLEKVARVIDPASWRLIDDYLARPEGTALHMAGVSYRDMALTKARAAIAAVAEWLDDALKDDDGRIYVPQFLRAAAGSAPTTPEVKK